VNIHLIAFIVLGVLAIASAIGTIATKHPIYSAMFLIVHFFALSALYLTLQSPFVAVLQILVYAGAIMVLVVFVIMLLNLNEDEKQTIKIQSRNSFGVVIAAIFFIMIVTFIMSNPLNQPNSTNVYNLFTAQSLGSVLFTKDLVAFEVVGILLLSAIIGAIVMAKKKLVD
jgi:NADH-quinone oxidoreductase subunit J